MGEYTAVASANRAVRGVLNSVDGRACVIMTCGVWCSVGISSCSRVLADEAEVETAYRETRDGDDVLSGPALKCQRGK